MKDAETSVLPLLARGIEKRCTRPVKSDTPAEAFCRNGLRALGEFKVAAGSAVPVLLSVLRGHPPGGLHTDAITAAGKIGPSAKAAVPFMMAGLLNPDTYVRQESIRALELIGPDARAAIPALEELRRKDFEEGYNRSAAIDQALAKIRGTAPRS